jgi:hypothetical protein
MKGYEQLAAETAGSRSTRPDNSQRSAWRRRGLHRRIDPGACRTRANLAAVLWVDGRLGDATSSAGESFDAGPAGQSRREALEVELDSRRRCAPPCT